MPCGYSSIFNLATDTRFLFITVNSFLLEVIVLAFKGGLHLLSFCLICGICLQALLFYFSSPVFPCLEKEAHACNPRYSGGDQEDHSLRPSWAKSL
jgi:hypothetical protein